MRMPRARVRSLMVAVALAALLLWGGMMGFRSFRHGRLASIYEDQGAHWREAAAKARGGAGRSTSVAAAYGDRIADYYAPLARKHRRAMWRPWEAVEPDPPAPSFEPARPAAPPPG